MQYHGLEIFILYASLMLGEQESFIEFKPVKFKNMNECAIYYKAKKDFLEETINKHIKIVNPDMRINFIACSPINDWNVKRTEPKGDLT